MKRRTLALILIPLLALIICTIGCAEEEPIYTPSTTPAITPTPVLTPTPTAKQTPAITPTHTYSPAPTALLLEITQPIDGAQVSTRDVLVSGKTIPGAVLSVSIDDSVAIADVDKDGNFSVTVNLEEGPNLIEVVASDQLGNEESSSIAVIYVP